MPMELQKDTLLVDQKIAQESAQVLVEGDILVPDIKPDISEVLSIEGKMEILKHEVTDHHVHVEGQIKFKILYTSEKGSDPLYSIDSSTVFKQDIPVDGVQAKMAAEVSGILEHIDYNLAHERRISVKAIVELTGAVLEATPQVVVSEVTGAGDLQVLKETIQYTELVGEGVTETLVKETFELGENEAPIREILKWNGIAVVKDCKVSDQKVIAGASLQIEVLYLSDQIEPELRVLKKEIPFTHFVDIPKIKPDMAFHTKFSIEEVYFDIKENIQGERKLLEVEGVTKSVIKAEDTVSKNIVVDAYSPTRAVAAHKQLIHYMETLGSGSTHITVREVIDIPPTYPPMEQLFSVQARPLLTGSHIVEDKLIIEGIVEATITYGTGEGPQPLYSFVQEVPFRNYAEVSGINQGMEGKVELTLEELTYQHSNSVQVDVKANIGASWKVEAHNLVEGLYGLEEFEGEKAGLEERSSVTVYFIQSGDTLWQIAKRYDTTVAKILESNHLTVQEDLQTGDFILIEKVHH